MFEGGRKFLQILKLLLLLHKWNFHAKPEIFGMFLLRIKMMCECWQTKERTLFFYFLWRIMRLYPSSLFWIFFFSPIFITLWKKNLLRVYYSYNCLYNTHTDEISILNFSFNTFAATDALARQHGATSHAGDALGRQSSMISTSGVPS